MLALVVIALLLHCHHLQNRCAKNWCAAANQSRRCCNRKRTLPVGRNHYHSPQKPEWLKAEILHIKARMPEAGCRTIADICNRRFAASHKVMVGKTYVHQLLQQHRYEIQNLRRDLKNTPPKDYPRNHIWGLDFTGKPDAQGRLHHILGIIDHGSRKLLHLQVVHDKTPGTVLASLQSVIHLYGKPQSIRTDNEGTFTSRAFHAGLKQHGIRHQRTTPGCPWQNGRIERLFGTLKNKLDQWQMPDMAMLNHDLLIFSHWYNHVRPHQNLGGQTPYEAWHGIDPYRRPTPNTPSPCMGRGGLGPEGWGEGAGNLGQERWFTAWEGLLQGYDLQC